DTRKSRHETKQNKAKQNSDPLQRSAPCTRSLSQNSSVLPEEEDEKSCSESEDQACRRKLPADQQECGVTPDSENLTLSSSGAIDQSSCAGTPLSSTITSPEGSYLAGVGGEGDHQQQHKPPHRGAGDGGGDVSMEPKEPNYSVALEEQDSEGNDVAEEDCPSPSHEKGGRSRCPELANNNQAVALCDTPSLGLDNEQASDSRFAGEKTCPVHIED
ncbi:hypothetical protein CRUP_023289, partial [Coryphaenoides rupestris]